MVNRISQLHWSISPLTLWEGREGDKSFVEPINARVPATTLIQYRRQTTLFQQPMSVELIETIF